MTRKTAQALAKETKAYGVKKSGLQELVQSVRQLATLPSSENSTEPAPGQIYILATSTSE
jgi:hypothetical protein